MPRRHIQVTIDLDRVRANTLAVARLVNVDIIAVVKADAYGLGAPGCKNHRRSRLRLLRLQPRRGRLPLEDRAKADPPSSAPQPTSIRTN